MGKMNIDTFFCLNGDIGIYFDRNVYGEVLNVSCVFFPNRRIRLVTRATKRVNFRKNVKKTIRWMKLILFILVYDFILYINCVFYFV